MKNTKILSFIVLSAFCCFAGCKEESADNQILITAGIGKIGGQIDDTEKQFQYGDTIVYMFEVNSPDGISKIEFSIFEGVGVNQKAPVVLSKVENLAGTTWILVDTIKNIQNDVRYSVYAEDMNRQYQTKKISAFLDVSRYVAQTLYDGLANGTSKTFLNMESGRTFFIANTINDPSGIDIGFAYMENQPQVLGCLVSFDEYWNTGNYATVVNNLNQPVVFRKSTQATSGTATWIKDNVKNSSHTKAIFDAAAEFTSVPDLFPDGKVALNLKAKDVVAFRTSDDRYGVIQVILVDAKSGSALNNQKINFAMVVDKKLNSSL
jgi:hypothetical protein